MQQGNGSQVGKCFSEEDQGSALFSQKVIADIKSNTQKLGNTQVVCFQFVQKSYLLHIVVWSPRMKL